MPWKESRVVDERVRFIAACIESDETFSAICKSFGISRKTGYKWIERYEELGPGSLEDHPPIARTQPNRTAPELIDAIVAFRKQHAFWGPKKIRTRLLELRPETRWPAASTIGEILKTFGMIRPRRRRPRTPPGVNPIERGQAPNEVWCADFKGAFRLLDGTRCHPLTITDEFSRFILKCEGLPDEKHDSVQKHFELAFREFGLPVGMRTDNGTPFASVAPGGLSTLSRWFVQLGIRPMRIDAGEPQQNGVHERMHRTLKQETTRPPSADLRSQDRRFDVFRREFNDERPHEALQMKAPARVYTPSRRAFPERIGEPEYADDFQVRICDVSGRVSILGGNVQVARLLANARVGLRECAEARLELFYGPVLLGHVDVSAGRNRAKFEPL